MCFIPDRTFKWIFNSGFLDLTFTIYVDFISFRLFIGILLIFSSSSISFISPTKELQKCSFGQLKAARNKERAWRCSVTGRAGDRDTLSPKPGAASRTFGLYCAGGAGTPVRPGTGSLARSGVTTKERLLRPLLDGGRPLAEQKLRRLSKSSTMLVKYQIFLFNVVSFLHFIQVFSCAQRISILNVVFFYLYFYVLHF